MSTTIEKRGSNSLQPKAAALDDSSLRYKTYYTRAVLGALVTTAVLTPWLYQPALDHLWSYLSHNGFYNLSTFETIWTVLNYAYWELLYVMLIIQDPSVRFDRRNIKEDRVLPKGMVKPRDRWKDVIIYMAPLLLLDLTMIKKFSGVERQDIIVSGGYAISNHTVEGISENFLLPTLHNFTLQSPLQLYRALPTAAPSSRRLVLELTASLLIYDVLFFVTHLSFHKLPFLQTHHKLHHSHGEIHPQITNKLDIIERMTLVLLANFSLNIIGSHVLTRTVFVTIFTGLLMEIHSGVDRRWWSYDEVLPRGWGSGGRRHAEHHRFGERYYEPFFCWCDDLYESVMSRSQRVQREKARKVL